MFVWAPGDEINENEHGEEDRRSSQTLELAGQLT